MNDADTVDRRRNPYIDDRAVEDYAGEADDEMETEEDEDDAEAQIRAADARDFPMDAIVEGHASRLSAPGPYRVPQHLLAAGPSRRSTTPPRTPPAATPAPSIPSGSSPPSNLDVLAAASALRERTPLFLPDPESRGPSPFNFIDSRNASPFYGIPMWRPPSPPPLEAHPDIAAPSSAHSRPCSPDVEPPTKRMRLESEALHLRRVSKFLDVHASDSDDDNNEDEEGSVHDSDIEWIDDKAVDPDDAVPHVPQDDPNELDDLRALASHYERAAHGYDDVVPDDDLEGDDGEVDDAPGENLLRGSQDSQLLLAVANATALVIPRAHPGSLPVGTWFYDHKNRLAVVVSPTEVVSRNEMKKGDDDPCVLEEAHIPLLQRNHKAVKPTPDELVPFWETNLPHVRGLVPLPLPTGTWIRLRGKKRRKHLAVVISATQCIVRCLPDSKASDICEVITKINPPLLQQNYETLQPTPEEMAPFIASRLSATRQIPFRGHSSALVPGDRVIIQDGPEPEMQGLDSGDSGFILEIREFDLTNSEGTVFGQRAKAKVTLIDFTPVDNITEAAPGRWVKLSLLRRHAFAPPPQLQLLDRVSCRGNIGLVRNIEADMVVTIELNDSTTMECDLIDVRRVFQHGDPVVVDVGEHKSRRGFIVGIHRGGVLQIFDSADLAGSSQDIAQSQNFRVHAAQVNFLNELSPTRSSQFSPTSGVIQRAVETTAILKTVGRRFEGMFVRVVGVKKRSTEGKHGDHQHKISVLKNKTGVVVGDFDSPKRAARLDAAKLAHPQIASYVNSLDFRGVMVTVKEHMKNSTFTVDIALLVHDATDLTLPEAVFLPPLKRFASRLQREAVLPQRPPTPPQAIEDADPNWGVDGKCRNLVKRLEFEKGRIQGEENGEWLCSPSLVKKRIDVVVQGAFAFKDTNKMKGSTRLRNLDDCIGMVAFAQPFPKVRIPVEKIKTWRVQKPGPGRMQTVENIPAICLRPLRTNDDGTAITTRRQRVLILDGDVKGDMALVGSYAEIRPEIQHEHGQHVVAVMSPQQGQFFFHVLHLCRSLNEQVDNPEVGILHPTVFD
ncbi:hypothetical protein B0H15DRAFT_806818 [Mycena belliarum]|uniref:Uncharacterized protein n=1 Tax=Mycena belliarum TaxID=1033014 RepID=A0AAD6TP04_9AGAR|nr:hypothetical protein B0H15DRAFT_806818 [Mycena belliae]